MQKHFNSVLSNEDSCCNICPQTASSLKMGLGGPGREVHTALKYVAGVQSKYILLHQFIYITICSNYN